jgi:hypothetical protein
MSSTLTGSTGIQTESVKMPEKAAFTTKPMLTMTDEQFAKAMFLKGWRKPTP